MSGISATILGLIDKGLASATRTTLAEAPGVERLRLLRDRLKTSRFQLAVLGQFKRGKSTVLNALLGHAVLPVGVVPVTAVPTFIAFGEPTLEFTLLTGESRAIQTPDPAALAQELSALVSEQGNPQNRKGLARVDVAVEAPLLASGLVLVDTPGIGSTHQHNTKAAQATLPECDAALYVLSFDPPITEAEVDYLRLVREATASLILIVNKADLVNESEQETVVLFLREVLTAQLGFPDATIFIISARDALLGKLNSNRRQLEESGMVALERFLVEVLVAKKELLLCQAVTQKTRRLISQIRLEVDIQHKALLLPLKTLEEKMAAFETSLESIEAERQVLADRLAGDRIRMLAFIREAEDQLAQRAQSQLRVQMNRLASEISNPIDLQNELRKLVAAFFDTSFQQEEIAIRKRLQAALDMLQVRADQIIMHIQELAADLMEVPRGSGIESDSFRVYREPYWVGPARLDTIGSLFLDTLYAFFPKEIRRGRLIRQLVQSVDRAITRNISNFDWAFRQTIDDAFRRYQVVMDHRLTEMLVATRGAMQIARERRLSADPNIMIEAGSLKDSVRELTFIAEELEHLSFASA